ncbi:septal ring lytic transglycosylase RlpA family protein, partial [Candidatus Azambacteria bacterium]|nr:septal ring lytic transglycosylase RlpA family protein [Candidatus Azambacteria bacterium]
MKLIFLLLTVLFLTYSGRDPFLGFDFIYQKGKASWYGDDFQGKLMSNREPFDKEQNTVAHRRLPLGTEVCIINPANGKRVLAVVTDRGPYKKGRIIDLSENLAKELDLHYQGVGMV